jgi:hypothetical protein
LRATRFNCISGTAAQHPIQTKVVESQSSHEACGRRR